MLLLCRAVPHKEILILSKPNLRQSLNQHAADHTDDHPCDRTADEQRGKVQKNRRRIGHKIRDRNLPDIMKNAADHADRNTGKRSEALEQRHTR